MRKDAFYFPHDSNAKDDPKIVMLIEQFGLEGYGIYWVLVETLRDQPDYRYPLALLPAVARRYATTKDKVEVVVMNYNLFSVTDDGQFFLSPSLCRRMELYDDKKRKLSESGRRGRLKQLGLAPATPGPPPSLAPATPGQEKRREESILEDKLPCANEGFAQKGEQADLHNKELEPTKFDLFWEAYPKRKAKIEAKKAWKQVKADSIFSKIMTAIATAKVSDPDWTKENGQFIPFPASWLRAGRWDDEVGVPSVAIGEKGDCAECANNWKPACKSATEAQRAGCTYFEIEKVAA